MKMVYCNVNNECTGWSKGGDIKMLSTGVTDVLGCL